MKELEWIGSKWQIRESGCHLFNCDDDISQISCGKGGTCIESEIEIEKTNKTTGLLRSVRNFRYVCYF